MTPTLIIAQDTSIRLMSYNIRMNTLNDGINAWPNRKDDLKAQVKFHDADILCVQEALPDQYDDILKGSNFMGVGVGRDDGMRKGEFSAVFYNKDRFKALAQGTFWLSETPDKPGKGWDAALNRICTWVRLYDLVNKKELIVFNTHYDHVGVQARINSALLIKQKITEIAGAAAVVLAGDLNVRPDTEAYKTIKTFLKDSREQSLEPPFGPVGTFNNFKLESDLEDRIDYVFVNDRFTVSKYGVLSEIKNKRFYSDHLPVFVKLYFK